MLTATGVWGDFVLPRRRHEPVLLVGAGIGVTPLVAQLAAGDRGDAVVVLVASSADEAAYLPELAASASRVLVVTPERPQLLPGRGAWPRGARLDAALLRNLVPDLARRHAYVSGPPRLIAEIAPALRGARSVRTDAFAGY